MKTAYPKSRIETQIGFDFVKTFLKKGCVSQFGVEIIDELEPLKTQKEFNIRINEVSDFILLSNLLPKGLNLHAWEPLTERINQGRITGFFLDLEEIIAIADFLSIAIDCFEPIESKIDECPALISYTHECKHLIETLGLINQIISHQGKIRENASPALRSLFKRKNSFENDLLKTLRKVFAKVKQDKLGVDLEPTVKNGRYVIPVPSAYRKQIKGVIQGESGTKNISYVEPLEVLEANNALNQINFDIEEEIQRLLKRITEKIGMHAKELFHAESKLGFIDYLQTVSNYASEFKAIIPNYSSTAIDIQLMQCRHPKLESSIGHDEVVPLDFDFSDHKRMMIISGPNAGGKSVALKTFSLAQYSLQCALPVCAAEGSKMTLFDHMMTDIGDNQNIESDLSTYSAHLAAMQQFLEPKKGKVFIAIDEIGAGTDPQLGGPMAEAMIQQFNEAGYYGIITTHFSNLKSLSTSLQHVFNASMLFDTDALKPLFKLLIGNPGSSFVFELSKRMGIPSRIIKNAKLLAGENKQQLETYLSEMDSKKSALHKSQMELDGKNIKIAKLIAEYEDLKGHLVKSKKEILEKAKSEASELLKGANQQIEQTIKQIKETQAERKVVANERKKIQKERDQVADAKHLSSLLQVKKVKQTKKLEWKVGDLASIDDETQAVEIIAIKNKKAVVVMNQIKTEVALKRLHPVEKSHKIIPKGNASQVLLSKMKSFRPKLDLRGKREQEAMSLLQTFLDEAYALGVNDLSVIHGRGAGALKRSTRALLKSLPYIEGWDYDHPDRGGDGATIIKLK